MEVFFKHLEVLGRSWKTIKWYRDRAKVFLRYLEETGHHVTDPIDHEVILRFYAHLRAQGRAPATLAGYDRAFRHFFGYLQDEGIIPINPMKKVARLKAYYLGRDSLTPEERAQLAQLPLSLRLGRLFKKRIYRPLKQKQWRKRWRKWTKKTQ